MTCAVTECEVFLAASLARTIHMEAPFDPGNSLSEHIYHDKNDRLWECLQGAFAFKSVPGLN